jgi:glycosyltransferase involved in cell wall biosynthesis
MKKVSIIIPARNEEESIIKVLDELNETIKGLSGKYSFEVIVVDDHSADRTAAVSTSRGAVVIANTKGPGKGNALRSGFEKAGGDYIVMMDADHSHRPEDLPLFLNSFEIGPDTGLVIGSRLYGGSDEYTRIRAFGNLIFTYIIGALHGRYLSDALNGYKAFRKEVFNSYKYTSEDFEIEVELLVNALRSGFKVKEVPSHERPRFAGQMKSRVVKHGFRFLFRIIWEWIRNKTHKRRAGGQKR